VENIRINDDEIDKCLPASSEFLDDTLGHTTKNWQSL